MGSQDYPGEKGFPKVKICGLVSGDISIDRLGTCSFVCFVGVRVGLFLLLLSASLVACTVLSMPGSCLTEQRSLGMGGGTHSKILRVLCPMKQVP